MTLSCSSTDFENDSDFRPSRGDQILNARSFENQGFSYVIEEEQMNADTLNTAIETVMNNRDTYIDAMKKSTQLDSIDTVLGLIDSAAKLKKKK